MPLEYPPTRSDDVVDDLHGRKVPDPYRWLEDTDAPEVADWIAAQNTVTGEWLDQVPDRERIRERLTELWDHPRTSAPWRRGSRWFQLRNTGLQDQDVLWTMDAPDDEGRVLLDPNLLSEDGTVALIVASVSRDGSLLAYATSSAGSDWLTWRVREVAGGKDRDDLVEWSKFSDAAWTHDGAGFFYSAYDPPAEGAAYEQRSMAQRLQYHRLGEPQESDTVLVSWPDDPEWLFGATVTADGRRVVIEAHLGTERRNRIWIADLDGETPQARPLIDEFDAAYHPLGSDGDVLYVLTDLDAERGRIVAVDLDRPDRSAWREVVPETDHKLESGRVVSGRIVAVYLEHASHRVRLFGLDGTPAGDVPLDGLVSVANLTGREDDHEFFLESVGFTHSAEIRRHDVRTGETSVLVPPALSVGGFETRQVFVTGKDGTKVPMFLVMRTGLEPAGDVPTLLYGYGGFDVPLTPACSVSWLVWLERGGLLAVANLRGGGEYGTAWYEAGRRQHKQNVFDDFIACSEWLIREGWTRTGRLAISGASNGGLLIGACMTQRPELFGACIPEVGVFDMLRFHKFTIGWAWTTDLGNPDDPDEFEVLYAYSPLHNLRPGTAYPPTMVVTGDHDDRVVPGHSFKFAATLQAAQSGAAPVLLRVETSVGHGAGMPVSKQIEGRTDFLSFLTGALSGALSGALPGAPS